jgi:hypothetical protein
VARRRVLFYPDPLVRASLCSPSLEPFLEDPPVDSVGDEDESDAEGGDLAVSCPRCDVTYMLRKKGRGVREEIVGNLLVVKENLEPEKESGMFRLVQY